MEKEKYVGNSKISEKPKKPLKLILGEKVVDETKLSDALANKINDMKNQIDSLNKDEYGRYGIAVSNMFGGNPHIGISQKTLTEAINNIWKKLEEITGEALLGFSWTVTPTFFISETGSTIHVHIVPVNRANVIEHLSLKVNGVEVASSDESVSSFDYDVFLTDTSTIRVDAQILGVTYHREREITRYREFFIGASNSFMNIMDAEHTVNEFRTARDITANDGDHIFVVINELIASEFIRADINGVEIPFHVTHIETPSGKTYVMYISENTYQAGTYNIDING